ncbi:MAG: hypothetical protein LBH57_05625, partial [Treponema sp.]|jgi:hypothetical protein|nr:hypothetical protein [Treponema sp.]
MTVYGEEAPKGTTLEDVWALIRETDRQMKETDRVLKEMSAETARRMRETDQRMRETARQMKETDRKIGNLGSRLGEVIEHLMSPKLHEKFEELGLYFTRNSRNFELRDRNKNCLTEVDVFLENDEYAMAVEVKTRLTSEDVKDHVKRLAILRKAADGHDDRRKYLGAVAGAVVDPEVSAYARKTGFYVIIPSGDGVDIEVPEGSKPQTW